MATQGFYLVGDEINTARHIPLSQIEDLASLKKTLAGFFHIVGKQGTIKFERWQRLRLGNINFSLQNLASKMPTKL